MFSLATLSRRKRALLIYKRRRGSDSEMTKPLGESSSRRMRPETALLLCSNKECEEIRGRWKRRHPTGKGGTCEDSATDLLRGQSKKGKSIYHILDAKR